MEAWMNGDRRNEALFPGGRKSPFVFLSEATDRKTGGRLPLSVRRFHGIFQDLRKKFPELGESFSPHVLRHTFVEEYIRAHPNFTPKERQDLCFLLGWSTASIMPDRYGLPAIVESGGKRSRGLSERRHERALKGINEDERPS
jgi:integrase